MGKSGACASTPRGRDTSARITEEPAALVTEAGRGPCTLWCRRGTEVAPSQHLKCCVRLASANPSLPTVSGRCPGVPELGVCRA